MSKKLIAVAAAAALALTGLVGIAPANAALVANFATLDANNVPTDLNVNTSVYASATAATLGAAVIAVPANNVLEYTSTAARKSLMKVTVTTAIGDAVSATASGGAKIVKDTTDAAGDPHKSTAGATTYPVTATTTATTFYVFTTSTAVQSLTITNGGNTGVYYFKATRGLAHTVTATGPNTASKGVTYKFSVTVKDVFGNPISTGLSITANGFVVSGLGALAAPTVAAGTNGTGGVWNFQASVGANGPGLITVAVGGTEAAADVAGLPDVSLTGIISVGASDPAVQITALTAQVAALTAQLAGTRTKALSVTKKKYNSLARKYNAQNPSARVALKK